ncbi:hypothetical protein OIO90_003200 [Microbotryomycetes sp. JL221]|nr:hypothetical protein OIO90_003200 [Microbotryomycetes sp. JL221]
MNGKQAEAQSDELPAYEDVQASGSNANQGSAADEDRSALPDEKQKLAQQQAIGEASTHTNAGPYKSLDEQTAIEYVCKECDEVSHRLNKITGPDKELVLYVFRYPYKVFKEYQMTMHAGDNVDAPIVVTISKRSGSSKNEVVMSDGRQFEMKRVGGWTTSKISFEFQPGGVDGPTFTWQTGLFSQHWKLLVKIPDQAEDLHVADWRMKALQSTRYPFANEGHLFLDPTFAAEREMILATAMAVQTKSAHKRFKKHRTEKLNEGHEVKVSSKVKWICFGIILVILGVIGFLIWQRGWYESIKDYVTFPELKKPFDAESAFREATSKVVSVATSLASEAREVVDKAGDGVKDAANDVKDFFGGLGRRDEHGVWYLTAETTQMLEQVQVLATSTVALQASRPTMTVQAWDKPSQADGPFQGQAEARNMRAA